MRSGAAGDKKGSVLLIIGWLFGACKKKKGRNEAWKKEMEKTD